MTIQIEENHAPGDWLVKHKDGKIHSIHTDAKKALKKMRTLNDKDFEENLNQGTDNGHTYESPYSAVAASKHYGSTNNPYNESVEELDEAKTPSLIAGTRKIASFGDHAHTAEVRHNKEFNEYEVHHYKNGMHQGEGPISFHDDKDDAIGTAKHEVGLHEDYSEKNPKIDLYHHEPGSEDHGKYLASTNWSPTVKHAVAGYETKNPEMVGKVKGMKAKGCCESVSQMVESILSGELNESKEQFKSILAEKIALRLDEVKIQVAQGIFAEEMEDDDDKATETFHNEHPIGQLKALSGELNTDAENTVYNKDGSVNKNSGTSKGGRVKDTFDHLDRTKTEVSPNTAKIILSKLELYKPNHSQRLADTMHGSKQGWTQAVQEILQDHNSPELSAHKFK